jgi:alkylation response protein AidB-like acyl-CoA dehydrogenase
VDWDDSPEQAAFRAGIREFFKQRLPQRYKRQAEGEWLRHSVPFQDMRIWFDEASWDSDRLSDDPAARAAAREWADALAAEGYVAAAWPKELGGAGLTTIEQFIFNEERERAGAPRVGGTGAMFLGSLLTVHGTPEQRAKYMPPIARGDVEWAQGYSEPGAGSDLGSLQLRAVRDGDDYLLNGQKIWSTPQTADAMYALVRTDSEAPKHRGISFLMVEALRIPGISMRPIENAAWDHSSFGETFFDNARVPVANRIGEENRGWYVAMTLMDFDRASISNTAEDRALIEELIEFLDTPQGMRASRVEESPTVRADIADRWIEIEVGYNLSLRLASMQSQGLIPNYEASMGQVFAKALDQRTARTGTKAFGLYATLWPGDPRAPMTGKCTQRYVRTIPVTIAGGSAEIQRNVIATRGLGLPRG